MNDTATGHDSPTHLRGGPFADSEADLARSLRDALAPAGPVERLLAEQVVQSALRLHRATRDEAKSGVAPGDMAWSRHYGLAERGLFKALDKLQKHRDDRPRPRPAPADRPHEPGPDLPAAPPERWRDWIGIDPRVSAEFPAVRDCRITADHLCGLLDGGWDLPKLRRFFPELTDSDLRAARACQADGMLGPWPPPPAPWGRVIAPP